MPQFVSLKVGAFKFIVEDGTWAKAVQALGATQLNQAERLELASKVALVTEAKYPVQVARYKEVLAVEA